MSIDSYRARDQLRVGEKSYEIFRVDAVEGSSDLPFSLKVLLENLLRTEDGANITADHNNILTRAQGLRQKEFNIGRFQHGISH